MNDFGGVLELQVESILAALGAQRDAQCREIEGESRYRTKELLRDSRQRMRRRLHQAVAEERQHREGALLEAQQRIETARRQEVLSGYAHFLDRAWPRLLTELQSRWSDAGTRRSWCAMAIAEAQSSLPADNWTVELASPWTRGDSQWLQGEFATRGLPPPELQTAQDLPPGLRIRCGEALLDATLDGLLARRPEIEAQLLACRERQLAGTGNTK